MKNESTPPEGYLSLFHPHMLSNSFSEAKNNILWNNGDITHEIIKKEQCENEIQPLIQEEHSSLKGSKYFDYFAR